MGRGLLFQRQLPWRGRLSRRSPRTPPTYAVLAILSDSYPPLKGRLPTCYSPVRHFTQGRSPFLVRLACVRPAANVRSEPGSNSPVNRDCRRQAGASTNSRAASASTEADADAFVTLVLTSMSLLLPRPAGRSEGPKSPSRFSFQRPT